MNSCFFSTGLWPAGSGFGELAGGEAPDDDLLALDPVGIIDCLAVEVRADGPVADHLTVMHSMNMAGMAASFSPTPDFSESMSPPEETMSV